ncbi:MAG: hypothetical protein ACT4OV_07265 [Microthrixaceae bacterium]
MSSGYEGSQRQLRNRRRARAVAVVLALSMLLPILLATVAAIAR